MATAGDVNGDGYADVIVGAPELHGRPEPDEGQGLRVAWRPTRRGSALPAIGMQTATQADADFGTSVATAGDVDGDGYSDVIVGAPGHAIWRRGRAYVYHGGPTSLSEKPAGPRPATWRTRCSASRWAPPATWTAMAMPT